jgi:BlaI family transcriptional regulator, penicillinase repressor
LDSGPFSIHYVTNNENGYCEIISKAGVEHRADSRRFLYSPLIVREDYVAHLAEQENLSDADISEIERLLLEMKS